MSTTRTTAPRRTSVTQKSSHTSLSCASPRAYVPRSSRSDRIDAVVVPASRGAAELEGAVRLANRLGSTMVALCSGDTAGDDVVAWFARSGCRMLVIDVPEGYGHDLMPARTLADRFRRAGGDRKSDLSLKRNLGLLLARLHGWGKILFLDDDIELPAGAVAQVAAALDVHQIAGMACREFPDNSVVCHARRMAGFDQGVFVSGAALGVNCHDRPLPFFPDLYNEDWFFFSRRVAARDVAHLGYAVQSPYDPFEKPDRARHEEFGDLLAEGLFALFEEQPREWEYRRRLECADRHYWEQFMDARRETTSLVELELEFALETGEKDGERLTGALRSLAAAADQSSRLSPDICVDYLAAWADDLVEWESATQRLRGTGRTAEALDHLGLGRWHDQQGAAKGWVGRRVAP